MAHGRRDDRIHPSLGRAHAPAQTRIDSLEQAAGRSRYGRVDVKETETRTALTDFHMGTSDGPPAWSLNPYMGCAHACAYCYVPDTLHAERRRWGTYVIAKTDLPRVLRKELPRRDPATVYISTATDAYQPVEEERRITRACLALLARHDWPVDILTRSPLVLRDMDILRRFSRIRVGLSIPTLDDALRRVIEPGAPPIEVRLRALHRLADAGFETYANYCPAYPPTRGITPAFIADTLASAGARWVNTSPWKYLQDVAPALRRGLAGTPWQEWVERVTDPRRQDAFHEALQVSFRRRGVPLHAGFFSEPFAAPRGSTPASGARHRSVPVAVAG